MNIRFPGLLDSSLNEIDRLTPTAGSVTLQMTGVSQATLTLPEDSPSVTVHDWVSIYTQTGLAGIYRVSNVSQNYKKQKDITLLHGIDILSDSVWAAQTDFSGTMGQFLTQLLNQQTHLINGVKPWVLGVCDDSSTVDKSINYSRLSELLSETEEAGGNFFLQYDQTSFPWTVSYIRKPAGVDSEFRLTRNVRSASVTWNDADLCTRLFLTVSTKHTDNQNQTTTDSTVRVYNNETAQAVWGIVEKTADIDTRDDIEEEDFPNADAWAQDFLARRAEPSVQIQIDGDELAQLTGDNWDELRIGRLCRVALPEYGHTFEERVVSVNYPSLFKEPSHVTVSLANTLPKVSETIASTQQIARRTASGLRSVEQKTEKEITQWSQVVRHMGDALDGTGVTTLYESGINLDATGGVTIYSLVEGLQALYGGITVNADGIASVVRQSGTVTDVFDPEKAGGYAKGDRVLYNGIAYEFTAAHTGAWTGNDVTLVASLQSQITQNAGDIALRVTETQVDGKLGSYLTINAHEAALSSVWDENGKVTAASIATSVNAEGSKAVISANRIKLVGSESSFLLDDRIAINTDGDTWFKAKQIYFSGSSAGKQITINNGTMNAPTVQINSAGQLKFAPSSQTDNPIIIDRATAANLITDVQIAGPVNNVFTLQYKKIGTGNTWNNASVTFSRATTLSGAWGGTGNKILTVSATQTNKNASGQTETTTVGSVVVGTWDYDSDEDKYSRSVQIKNGNTVSQTEYLELPSFTASWANGGQSVPHHAIYTVSSSSPSGTLFETEGYIVANSAWKLDGSGKNTWKKDIYWRVGSTDYATLEFDASGAYNQGVIDAQGQISPITYYQQVTVSPSDIVLDTVNGYSNGNLNVDIEATTATNSLPTSDPNYYSDSTTQQINIPVSTEVVNAAQDTHSAPGSATWVRVNLMSGNQFLYRVTGLGLEFPTNDPSNPSVQGITFDTSTGKYRVVAAAYNSDSGTKTYYSQVNREFVANAAIRHGMQQVVWANPSWNDNTLTVGTSGRLNASGTADNLTKTVALSGSWHYGTHGQTQPSAATANAFYSVTSRIDSGAAEERFFTQLSGSLSTPTFTFVGNTTSSHYRQYSYYLSGSVKEGQNDVIALANGSGSSPKYVDTTAALNAVNIVSDGWTNGTIPDGYTYPTNTTAKFKTDAPTASPASLPLYLTTESTWTNHTKNVYLRPNGSSATNTPVGQLIIDASSEYGDGKDDGFDICHDSIGLSASTQTLSYGQSLTIYPKAKQSVSSTSASNITTKGITITAPSKSDDYELTTVTLQGSQVTVSLLGSAVTITPINKSYHRQMLYYSEKQLYYQTSSGEYKPAGNTRKWWYESSSGGYTDFYAALSAQRYYNSGGTATYYTAGTTYSDTYYKKKTTQT